MIPNSTLVAEVTTNMQGRQVKPGFDPGSLTHLMDLLAGVYSDPTEAVAREYITNALDAQREAGNMEPIKVTLPSMWQPNYSVQDFGTGMSRDTMENVYVNYGASTKRDNNEANGMLGIGAKSAYAYSNSFVIVSVKDGLRNALSFGRNDSGDPVATFMEENVPTDEPNGTTVTIPVKDTHYMRRAVERVCRVMPEGAVLVDGNDLSERSKWTLVAKDIKDDDGNLVIHNLWTIPSQYWSAEAEARIIMGNVAYQPTKSIVIDEFRDQTVYAEVAMGAVAFAPSREKLKDSALTTRTQELIKKAYKDNLAKSLIEKVLSQANASEALVEYHKVSRTLKALGHGKVAYRGKDIPQPTDAFIEGDTIVARSYYPYRSRTTTGNTNHLTYEAMLTGGTVIIKGAPDRQITTTMKRKLNQYNDREQVLPRDKHGSNYYASFILIIDGKMPKKNSWVKDLKIIDWATIEAEVLPKKPRSNSGGGGGVKTRGKYHVLENRVFNLREIENDETNLYYINARDLRQHYQVARMHGVSTPMGDSTLVALIERIRDTLGQDAVVVDVYANRLDKFKREFKHAVPLTGSDVSDKMVAAVRVQITDEVIEGWATFNELGFSYRSSALYDFIPDADPDKKWLTGAEEYRKDYELFSWAQRVIPYDKDFTARAEAARSKVIERKQKVRERYPLIDIVGSVRAEHRAAMRRYFENDWNNYNDSQEDENATV